MSTPRRAHAARRPRAARKALAVAAALGLASQASVAGATPTVWQRALDPHRDERGALIAKADSLLLRYERLRRSPLRQEIKKIGPLWLLEARAMYERAGAATARDTSVRLRYAAILSSLGEYQAAATSLEALLRADPPAPVRAEALADLAVCYARLGRQRDEIKIYDEALNLEPHNGARSVLLANRAEAFMVLGDLTHAVEGYRAALGILSSMEVFRYGVTTLWGLSVALDRSGDLSAALEHIGLARMYDRSDQRISGPGWFYTPPYEQHWYEALGAWEAARSAEIEAARAEQYAHAIGSWDDYIASAPPDDKWLPLASARRAQCEKERAEAARRRAARGRAKAPQR